MERDATLTCHAAGADISEPARVVVCNLPDDLCIATGEPEMLLAALGAAFAALFDNPGAMPGRQ